MTKLLKIACFNSELREVQKQLSGRPRLELAQVTEVLNKRKKCEFSESFIITRTHARNSLLATDKVGVNFTQISMAVPTALLIRTNKLEF